jgi:hypothetical protein
MRIFAIMPRAERDHARKLTDQNASRPLGIPAILSSFGGSLKSLQVSLNTGDDA